MNKIALFSLDIHDRVEEFAQFFYSLGWQIVASRETHNILSKKNLPVIDLAEFVNVKENYGFPPTLHPKIEACLTLSGGTCIDLVYVIPYSLSVGNDIGGRALLALAAKGNRIPVMSTSDMELVIKDLKNNGKISNNLHKTLINKVNALIASHYDDLIHVRNPYDIIFGSFEYNLKNGENPYQIPAELFSVKRKDSLAISAFRQLSGDLPCFTNLADSDSIIYTICLVCEAFNLKYKRVPYVCIAAKHGNPCGLGVSWHTPSEALEKALFGNPKAIWGGEVIVNFDIEKTLVQQLFESEKRKVMLGDAFWMLDIILAPSFTKEAIKILGQRKNRKLFENKELLTPFLPSFNYTYRFVRGGFLRQPLNNFVLDFSKTKLIGPEIKEDIADSLIIAWAVAWSSNHGGNEIALVRESQLLGVGGGPSTIESALVAITRAKYCGHNLENSIFAANAFFPFIDAPQILADVYPRAGLVPDGGKRANLIQNYFKEKGVSMVYLPEQYRGFCRH